MVSICHVFRWFLGWGYCLVDTNTQLVFLKFAVEMVKGDEDKKLFANIFSRFAITRWRNFAAIFSSRVFSLSARSPLLCIWCRLFRSIFLITKHIECHTQQQQWLIMLFFKYREFGANVECVFLCLCSTHRRAAINKHSTKNCEFLIGIDFQVGIHKHEQQMQMPLSNSWKIALIS